MDDKNQAQSNEELNKSLDLLIDELFSENVEKSIEISKDSQTTADAAVSAAPKMVDDASRGAGRPQEIHDVPSVDEDGQKSKDYDAAIAQKKKEEENEEAKKQAKTMDQTKEAGRSSDSPSNSSDPRGPMFKSISETDYAEYVALKTAKEEGEVLKKADLAKKETEELIKSAVNTAVSTIKTENDTLKKTLTEQGEILKALANKPKAPKSITNVNVIEKSMDPATGAPKQESFTKSEMLDAAFTLALAKSIPAEAVTEMEFTGTIVNPIHRKLVEQKLNGK